MPLLHNNPTTMDQEVSTDPFQEQMCLEMPFTAGTAPIWKSEDPTLTPTPPCDLF